MIVSVVSMPDGVVARTSLSEARERMAVSDCLMVDIELLEETPPEEAQTVSDRLGLDSPQLAWFGRDGEPVRADFDGRIGGFVMPVVVDDDVVHVHVLLGDRYMITMHRGPVGLLQNFVARLPHDRPTHLIACVFLLLQGALETFRRSAAQGVLEVEDLEDEMFERRRQQQVYRLALLRRRASLLHHELLPFVQAMLEVLARRAVDSAVPEDRRALHRTYERNMAQALAAIESLQDATRRVMVTYSSLVGGEQNAVINRLTVVSTIFLPLTFITGFFGMNFTYLTNELTSEVVFWLLAVALQVAILFAALYVVRHTQFWRELRENPENEPSD
ncbi:CorA family divalent cation transporter [Streptomyces sp. NBC_00820]|uniref:CorA family divalent cation transporter n=1 Tax=Streptomyces sp. NBC_00820 TaxID=2975842 RepID=UPI002ED4FF18|nr:CorA family divalent cation transporter [Streptomyces sp. NBC_00820]